MRVDCTDRSNSTWPRGDRYSDLYPAAGTAIKFLTAVGVHNRRLTGGDAHRGRLLRAVKCHDDEAGEHRNMTERRRGPTERHAARVGGFLRGVSAASPRWRQ